MALAGDLYHEQRFIERLRTITIAEDDIKGLGKWLVANISSAHAIVSVWARELQRVQGDRKIAFVFLANEVMLTSKEKSMAFINEWKEVLPKAFHHISATTARTSIGEVKVTLQRLVRIWVDRHLFPLEHAQVLQAHIVNPDSAAAEASRLQHSEFAERLLHQQGVSPGAQLATVAAQPKPMPEKIEVPKMTILQAPPLPNSWQPGGTTTVDTSARRRPRDEDGEFHLEMTPDQQDALVSSTRAYLGQLLERKEALDKRRRAGW
eukprot:TRINITY_DN71747_c0_g1_i1.p1 TRINITY_DN71747_c0_g1~~TRINITY_DN71747_c0_g1_i1.p1  ORF type:complete len:264 (+),score=36.72 TRINITY_DN71747_c0_g1_i1:20-811(+)